MRVDHEGPGDKLGMQFPTQAPAAQVHPQVIGMGIRHRQMVVAQQGLQMFTAGLTNSCIRQHDHMADRDRGLHGLGRARMYLVVQRSS